MDRKIALKDYVISPDNIKETDLEKIGGKASGLYEAIGFIDKIKSNSDINISIPKTYILSSDFLMI